MYYKIDDDAVVLSPASNSPGTGWISGTVQTAINAARTNGRPLFVLQGSYATGPLTVDSSVAGSCEIQAVEGDATFAFSGGAYLLKVNGIANVRISGMIFDGQNASITDSSQQAGLVSFANATNFSLKDSIVTNSTQSGVVARDGALGTIGQCVVSNCSIGIQSYNSQISAISNTISSCSNNGIVVTRVPPSGSSAFDGSVLSKNMISNISTAAGGTGQNGNGIDVYRAIGVKTEGNTIFTTQFSSIRYNASGQCQIIGNFCYGARECSIFIEATTSGLDLIGGMVSNNIVQQCGDGIKVVNSGGSQGVARRIVVSGNVVTDVQKNTINDAGYVPTASNACGIQVEGTCAVTGNIVENAAGFGIVLGTNAAAANLLATGNIVSVSPVGIGFSNDGGAGQTSIQSNMVTGSNNGSITPVYLMSNGNFARSGTSDLGNTPTSQVGNVFVGNNRSY